MFPVLRRIFSKKLVIAAVAMAVPLVAWKLGFPVRSYDYRLTLDVERNGEVHSGSSVIELRTVSTGFLAGIGNIPKWETHPHGEAVFVDLGDGANLVALLNYDSAGSIHQTSVLPSRVILGDETTKKHSIRFDSLSTFFPSKLVEAKGKTYPVQLDQLPPMIHFRNLNDPTTAERVDPANMAPIYGAGVVFRDAHLEITEDPVTTGIFQRLPWLRRFEPTKATDTGIVNASKPEDMRFWAPWQIFYSNLSME